MKLWICEKPSVARIVAEALGKRNNKTGYIEIVDKIKGEEHIVTWCVGHVLSTLEPDEYDDKYKTWKFADLPIVPTEWKLKTNPNTKDQLKILKELIKKADSFVNVGDPDREGQLLVDELLIYCKVYNKPTTRCYINDMNLDKAKKAIEESYKLDNKKLFGIYEAGLGRQKADWLIGMNCSRGATLMAQKSGFSGVVTIGRVQTPTLAIIVNRDKEIDNFNPVDFYNIFANFEKDKEVFKGSWMPRGSSFEKMEKASILNKREEATEEELELEENNNNEDNKEERPKWLDESYRLIDEKVAKEIIEKIKKEKQGKVIKYKKETKAESRPKLFNLSGLQARMSKFGLSADQTLSICQKLYENGFLTYPRTDCPFLPTSLKEEVKIILNNLVQIDVFTNFKDHVDDKTKNKIWNDKEAGVHHAIIPTQKKPMLGTFSNDEYNLYITVAQSYFANFMPECIVDTASINVEIANEIFSINGKIIKQMGWKELFKNSQNNQSSEEEKTLPYLEEGTIVNLENVDYTTAKTTPPSLFDQAKLPEVMANVYRLVKEPELRKKMKELNGIGTEATRAKVIDDLKKRKYVEEVKKGKITYLTSTELGKAVVEALPEKLTSFILTSQWETFLEKISKGEKKLEEFDIKQKTSIQKMMELFAESDFSSFAKLDSNIKTNKKFTKTNVKPAEKTGDKCPKCGGDLVIRTVKQGKSIGKTFTGCSNFPKCDYTKW